MDLQSGPKDFRTLSVKFWVKSRAFTVHASIDTWATHVLLSLPFLQPPSPQMLKHASHRWTDPDYRDWKINIVMGGGGKAGIVPTVLTRIADVVNPLILSLKWQFHWWVNCLALDRVKIHVYLKIERVMVLVSQRSNPVQDWTGLNFLLLLLHALMIKLLLAMFCIWRYKDSIFLKC